MASTGANVEIAIQPPAAIGVNRWISPPVVARTRDRQLLDYHTSGSKQLFATAVLYSSNMVDYTTTLSGNWSCSAQLVTQAVGKSRAGSEEWLYFVFNPVSVGMEGLFYFKIVVSALSLPSSPEQQGMSEVIGGRMTTQFSVLSDAPRPYRLNSSEKHVLRVIKDAGLYKTLRT